jgi:hypothetical protein
VTKKTGSGGRLLFFRRSTKPPLPTLSTLDQLSITFASSHTPHNQSVPSLSSRTSNSADLSSPFSPFPAHTNHLEMQSQIPSQFKAAVFLSPALSSSRFVTSTCPKSSLASTVRRVPRCLFSLCELTLASHLCAEVLLRVHACSLNSTSVPSLSSFALFPADLFPFSSSHSDEVIRNDLVPSLGRNLRPGMAVYGTVVKVGQQSNSGNVKIGEKVAGSSSFLLPRFASS